MAQTRKRRRRKHRGTQGGRVDTRPRGRPRNRAEAKQRARSGGRSGPRRTGAGRTVSPPSWRSAFFKGAAAAAIFFLLIAVAFDRGVSEALPIAVAMLAFYVPMAYLTDRFFFNRQLRKEEKAREQAQTGG